MYLKGGFGAARIPDPGRPGTVREATDAVVPNDHLGRRDELMANWDSYPTVPEELADYEEMPLAVSIVDEPRGVTYDAAVGQGSETLALKATVGGEPLYFLGRTFVRSLDREERSVVRFHGGGEPQYLTVEVDTRKELWLPRPPTLNFRLRVLKNEERETSGPSETIAEDQVIPADALVGVESFGHGVAVAGAYDACVGIVNFLESRYHEGHPPLGVAAWDRAFVKGDTVVAATRTTKTCEEVFLTREGYQTFAEQGLAVLRGQRSLGADGWSKLTVLFHPEMMT